MSFRTVFLKFPARCRLGPCCSSLWSTYSTHEISDPWVRIVFVHRPNSDLNSTFTMQNNKLQITTRAQFWCSLGSNLFVQISFHLLANCTHDKPLDLWTVRILQCLSSWNTVVKNPASIQNLLTLSCCDNFSIRSSYCMNRWSLLTRSSQSKKYFIVWVILSMNTDACNVEDINIHHITECLSLSFVASFEDWFCFFRTWSFTPVQEWSGFIRQFWFCLR